MHVYVLLCGARGEAELRLECRRKLTQQRSLHLGKRLLVGRPLAGAFDLHLHARSSGVRGLWQCRADSEGGVAQWPMHEDIYE